MPIYDYKCPSCGKEKNDELVRSFCSEVKCDCGEIMNQKISAPNIGGMDEFGRSGNH